jgi:hypothetical protein
MLTTLKGYPRNRGCMNDVLMQVAALFVRTLLCPSHSDQEIRVLNLETSVTSTILSTKTVFPKRR